MKCYEIVKETIKATAVEFDAVFDDVSDIITERTKEVVFRSGAFDDEHLIDEHHEEALYETDKEYESKGYNHLVGTDLNDALKSIGDTYTYYYRAIAEA